MTSLTSMAGLSSGAQNAGRTMMNARIAAAVSKGTISATDQTALGSALDSIDSTIASGGSAGSGTTGTSMKDRMESLIDDQVTKGTLTSDQAGELKQFFAAGGRQGESTDAAPGDGGATATKVAGAGGVSGPHGHGGAHHAHHAHASSGTSDTDSTDATPSTVGTDAAASTDTEKSQLDTLIGFLEKMRSSIGNQSTYGTSTASGSTSSSDSTGLVFSGVA